MMFILMKLLIFNRLLELKFLLTILIKIYNDYTLNYCKFFIKIDEF